MNIFNKIKYTAWAKKGDYSNLLKDLVFNYDDQAKEYIYNLLRVGGQEATRATITVIYQAKHFAYFVPMVKVLAQIGDETTLDNLINYYITKNEAKNWAKEITDAIHAIYKRHENPVVRLHIIEGVKEQLALILKLYGGFPGDYRFEGIDYLFGLLEDLHALDMDWCDVLVPKLVLHEEKVSKILISFGPGAIEKLIPWLGYKKDMSRQKVTWHQGKYNSMEDSYDEGWEEVSGDKHPIASKVRKVLFEFTGEWFNSTAAAKKWWELHKDEWIEKV